MRREMTVSICEEIESLARNKYEINARMVAYRCQYLRLVVTLE